MRRIPILALTIALILPGTAIAANGFRAACQVDTLCSGVKPGGGGIMRCLKEHKTELTQECKIAIADRVLNKQGKKQRGAGKAPDPSDDGSPE